MRNPVITASDSFGGIKSRAMFIECHTRRRICVVNMSCGSGETSKTFGIIILCAFFLNAAAQSIDCTKPPPLVDPQTCCTDGGRDEVSERCARKFGITGSQTQTPPSMDVATCLAECVLSESKYLAGQNLNIAVIRADLMRKFPTDPQYVDVMTRSYQKCIPIAQRKLEDIRKSPQGAAILQRQCSPFSGIVLGCTYMEYFQNCPAGHWTPSPQCKTAKEFLQKCAVF